MLPRFLTLAFFLIAFSALAQVPFYTVLDTAKAREMRTKKIHFVYKLDQPYDSVTGKLKQGAHADTMWTEYDRMGRETGFSYVTEKGARAFVRLYINAKGQVVRRFSYDNDSTNGFLDYWTYNDKGQVVVEMTYTREGLQEVPFGKETFEYDESGKLARQKSFYIDDHSTRFDHMTLFSYPQDLVVRITLDERNDTLYIDTTGGKFTNAPFWSRRYRYMNGGKGKPRLMLVTETKEAIDTTRDGFTKIYHAWRYDYHTGELREQSSDTICYNHKQHVVESRDERHIDKYFYRPDGSFDCMMQYDRRLQPLFRRTEALEYYK